MLSKENCLYNTFIYFQSLYPTFQGGKVHKAVYIAIGMNERLGEDAVLPKRSVQFFFKRAKETPANIPWERSYSRQTSSN